MTDKEKQFNQWFDEYADGVKVFEEADMKQAYLRGRAELEKENKVLKQNLEDSEIIIAGLKTQIEKMKNCKNCANYMISGKCPCFFRTGWCKNWEMAKGVKND